MHSSTSFKQEFLKKWAVSLKFCNGSTSSSTKKISFLERKKIIKLSADIAMASARNGKTCWGRALISKASKEYDENYNILITTVNPSMGSLWCNKRVVRSKRILRSCTVRRIRKNVPPRRLPASSIAKTMVKKRTQVLKGLVPGGESMDELSLLEETLDYILSLQAQVEVMSGLLDASNLNSLDEQPK